MNSSGSDNAYDGGRMVTPQRGSGLGPIMGALNSLIDALPSGGRIREAMALAAWPVVVGPQAAAASRAERVWDGVLTVCTRSSVWSQELALHQQHIIRGLNRHVGRPVITQILFRPHGVPPAQPVAKNSEPDAETLLRVPLEPEEAQELERRRVMLERIPSEQVRSAIYRTLEMEARMRHWRLEQGWRLCRRCYAPHCGEEALCPICRLG